MTSRPPDPPTGPEGSTRPGGSTKPDASTNPDTAARSETDGRTRREFVVLSSAGLGALLLASGCGSIGDEDRAWEPRLASDELGAAGLDLPAVLRDLFGEENLPGVRAVGRAYARRFAPDTDALAADLGEAVALLRGPSLGPARAVLATAIRTDFETARLASVAGWQLARTEARLAGLAEALDVEASA